MRTIKFRGKRADNGEWVYGYYVLTPKGKHLIYYKPFDGATSNTYHEVIPETVGQFTGLHDKNGKEIYEGDIIGGSNGSINGIEWEFKREIKWSDKLCGFTTPKFSSDRDSTHYYNVIGNIHDNPELLNN